MNNLYWTTKFLMQLLIMKFKIVEESFERMFDNRTYRITILQFRTLLLKIVLEILLSNTDYL